MSKINGRMARTHWRIIGLKGSRSICRFSNFFLFCLRVLVFVSIYTKQEVFVFPTLDYRVRPVTRPTKAAMARKTSCTSIGEVSLALTSSHSALVRPAPRKPQIVVREESRTGLQPLLILIPSSFMSFALGILNFIPLMNSFSNAFK